jgi:hypothetical protein
MIWPAAVGILGSGYTATVCTILTSMCIACLHVDQIVLYRIASFHSLGTFIYRFESWRTSSHTKIPPFKEVSATYTFAEPGSLALTGQRPLPPVLKGSALRYVCRVRSERVT